MLKQLRDAGFHFRKQASIGPYIVDFVCHRAKLAIEVDGGQHNDEPHIVQDANRTAWLQSQGYRVLRFWNNEVAHEMDGVMSAIGAVLEEQRERFSVGSPHP